MSYIFTSTEDLTEVFLDASFCMLLVCSKPVVMMLLLLVVVVHVALLI